MLKEKELLPKLSDFVLEKSTLKSYVIVNERDITADINNEQ